MRGVIAPLMMYGAMTALLTEIRAFVMVMTYGYLRLRRRRHHRNNRHYSIRFKVTRQLDHLYYLVSFSDETCKDHLRMTRDCFNRLCFLLENLGGLSPTRNVTVAEQVAILLTVLSHNTKNRIVKHSFRRSGYTISKYFNSVLNTLLKLHTVLLIAPQPVPDNSNDSRWRYFKGCLGALDGTYFKVMVPTKDIPRYRNRKGDISVNVLGVCDQNMNYIYVLAGWEGSAADCRVLRDAITRTHGLEVPNGNYYLVDGGYTNSNGFLSPYRGVRYHLKEWDVTHNGPQNYREYFNLKHAKARNVIERSFGILKERWKDSNARLLKNKEFPYYYNWIQLFGKDRATGENAQTFPDVVQNILNNSTQQEPSIGIEQASETTPFNETSQADFQSEFLAESSSTINKGKSKKQRLSNESDERFFEAMNLFCDKTESKIGDLTSQMSEVAQGAGSKFDSAKKREGLYDTLCRFNFMSLSLRVRVCQYFAKSPNELDMFYSFPDDAKAEMLKNIMNQI